MPEFEAAPRGFGRVTLAFVGYVALCFGIAVGAVELGIPNEWFLFVFVGASLVLLKPLLRLARRLTPETP